jgi:hypothetical protein
MVVALGEKYENERSQTECQVWRLRLRDADGSMIHWHIMGPNVAITVFTCLWPALIRTMMQVIIVFNQLSYKRVTVNINI